MYVKRNKFGKIESISHVQTEKHTLFMDDNAIEIHEFIAYQNVLNGTDRELARVLEDLIDVLIKKGVLQFTDLPVAAQEKLMLRKSIRHKNMTESVVTIDSQDNSILP